MMGLQWSWQDFKNLYKTLDMDRVYANKTKAELGIIDPEVGADLDKGMVAKAYIVAIFDYFNKDRKLAGSTKEKLAEELYRFAKDNEHVNKLRKELKYMDDSEVDDKEEKKQFKALHSEGDAEEEKFAHDVLHELHRHLEPHPEDVSKPKGSH